MISFTGAMGQVKFDIEGNMTGPEGTGVIPKSDIGILGRLIAPNPLLTAPPGALIGAVYQGRITGETMVLSEEDLAALFYIGKGKVTTIQADGYLVLGVNDGFMYNNTGWLEVTIQRHSRARR